MLQARIAPFWFLPTEPGLNALMSEWLWTWSCGRQRVSRKSTVSSWSLLEMSAPWNKVLARVKTSTLSHTSAIPSWKNVITQGSWGTEVTPSLPKLVVSNTSAVLGDLSIFRRHSTPYPRGMVVKLQETQIIFLNISHQYLLLMKMRVGSNSPNLQDGRFGIVEVNNQTDSR